MKSGSTIQGVQAMTIRDGVYLGGKWIPGEGETPITLVSSGDESVHGSFSPASIAQAALAVESANEAFPLWSETPREQRTAALRAIADGIESRQEEFAELSSHEVGTTIGISRAVQVGLALKVLRSTADAMDALELEEHHEGFVVEREALGVVVAITPWNFPLHQIVAKIAPALAAGCTVVVKPAELSSLSAIALFEVIDGVGLPAGAANLICGRGTVVGEALVTHPNVDMVSFTGSTGAGARIGEQAIRDIKKVALELGGKSATIILEDADLEKAVPAALASACTNNGQMCSALTRLVVMRSQLSKVEELLVSAADSYVVGDPFDAATRVGPMVSARQRDSVVGYIEKGIAEGATLLVGGPERPFDKGFFVKPTVFTNVDNKMVIAQEEIFGPVLVVIPVDSEEEAIMVANDSEYGLSGAVWSGDKDHALDVARKIRTGQVAINGAPFYVDAPFGGYKKSGVGRELGKHGLEEFFEYKALRY